MDNRLNRLRKEMGALRVDMLRAADAMREQVDRDRDCAEAAQRVLDMRAKMAAMVQEWRRLGGHVNLPTVEERLREKRGAKGPRRR